MHGLPYMGSQRDCSGPLAGNGPGLQESTDLQAKLVSDRFAIPVATIHCNFDGKAGAKLHALPELRRVEDKFADQGGWVTWK